MEWKLIETAPIDGSDVDLWSAAYNHRIPDCRWSTTDSRWIDNERDDFIDDVNDMKVSHWMPQPNPPK